MIVGNATPMVDSMNLDIALLHATIAANTALDDKLRRIGWYAMKGHPLNDGHRFAAVADSLEVEGLRRDRMRAEVTQ